MGDAEKHDPRKYLDKAWAIMDDLANPEDPDSDVMVDADDLATAIAQANLWASMATAAAMLMPTPEEVIATYEETRAEVLDEVQGDLVRRAHKAREILDNARRDGSRRHPAILAALEALGDLDG